MSVIEETDVEAGVEPDRHPGSLLDHVRARREEIARESIQPLTLEIPGTGMGVRYRYPDGGADAIVKAFEQSQKRGRRGGLEAVAAAARAIALCCDEIVARYPGGEWEPLDATTDQPLRFGQRLAGLLGIELPHGQKPSAVTRHIVRHAFSPRAADTGVYDGDFALLDHASEVTEWLQGGLREAGEELEGE